MELDSIAYPGFYIAVLTGYGVENDIVLGPTNKSTMKLLLEQNFMFMKDDAEKTPSYRELESFLKGLELE